MTTKVFLVPTVFVLAASSALFADPTEVLTVTNGTSTATCTPSGFTHEAGTVSGTCSYIGNGVLMLVGSIGNWSLDINTASSYNTSGSAAAPNVQLITQGTTTQLGSVMTVSFSDSGFTTSPIVVTADNTSDSAGFSTLYQYYYGNSDTTPGTIPIGPNNVTMTGAAGAKAESPVKIAPTPEYTLTEVQTLTDTSLGAFSNVESDVSGAAPEPSLYGALAVGFGGLVVGAWRRRAKA